MEHTCRVLKGDICWSPVLGSLKTIPNGYLVWENGVVQGVYEKLPEKYQHCPVADYTHQLIIPGLVDLHLHAPQYAFRGMGMDLELLDWLNEVTFPEESKYGDLAYARKAYTIFAHDLKRSATTRACIFGTLHTPATELLMDLLEETGLQVMVGKVNMDRNSPDTLIEENAEKSARDTIQWLESTIHKYTRVKPILTPRFIPSCSDELMHRLKEIQMQYQLPMQSHLSENQGEVSWVKELCPKSDFYGDAYDQFGLFGNDYPTIMAHCVYSQKDEMDLMKERGVFVAHCPDSNTNLSSGIAPVRKFLELGIPTGLGTDVAGGCSVSLLRAMAQSIQMSKLRWRILDDSLKPLTVEEAFYLGTKGGGTFFGKVGSFEPGYEMDAIAIDDHAIPHPQDLTLKERLERAIYLADDRHISAKYVAGRNIWGS